MNCHLCNKIFPTVSSLNRHQRTSKCANAIKCESCDMFYVNVMKHYSECRDVLQKKLTDIQRENEDLRSEIKKLTTYQTLDVLNQQIRDLRKKFNELVVATGSKVDPQVPI